MTQKSFAQFIDLSEGSLSSVFNGRTRPNLNIVEAIKKKLPAINTDWLMFGKGQMFSDQMTEPLAPTSEVSPHPSDQRIAFEDEPQTPSATNYEGKRLQGVSLTPNFQKKNNLKNFDKPTRQITEIRVFFDDQTWESFVPKK